MRGPKPKAFGVQNGMAGCRFGQSRMKAERIALNDMGGLRFGKKRNKFSKRKRCLHFEGEEIGFGWFQQMKTRETWLGRHLGRNGTERRTRTFGKGETERERRQDSKKKEERRKKWEELVLREWGSRRVKPKQKGWGLAWGERRAEMGNGITILATENTERGAKTWAVEADKVRYKERSNLIGRLGSK